MDIMEYDTQRARLEAEARRKTLSADTIEMLGAMNRMDAKMDRLNANIGRLGDVMEGILNVMRSQMDDLK